MFLMVMLACAFTSFSQETQAQSFLKSLKDKAVEKVKDKVSNKVEDKVGEATDNVLNGKKSKGDKKADKGDDTNDVTTQNQKSDFVPGSVIVFEDAVSGEKVGEFPSKWDLERGNAEVATVNGQQVIEMTKEDSWIKPLINKNPKNYFGDQFSVEFDLMYTEGEFEIDFMHPNENADSEIFTLTWGYDNHLFLSYVPGGSSSNTDKSGSSSQDQKTQLNNKRWHHYAISFNKRAIKIYVDNVRYFNIPNAKAGAGWMTFFYRGSEPAYLKNVRIAKGAGELYDRNATDASDAAIAKAMAETGKFVTNNILFETGKADLKTESMIEIMKVADYMKKNPKVRFEVQGHCDNQGSDKVNDPLSQKRSEAIVAALVKLGVDEWNLKAVGKGSHEPVADNKTEEGRAKNRRVEFIKK